MKKVQLVEKANYLFEASWTLGLFIKQHIKWFVMYPLGRSRMLCSCYDEKVVWRRLCPGLTVGRQAEGGSGMEESLWAILNPIEDADSDSRRLQPHAGLLTERADKKLQRSSF